MVGWGASFYTPTPSENFNSVIGQAEVKWYITPNPSSDPAAASLTLSSVSLGFLRDFYDSYIGTYFERDRGYLSLSYFYGGKFLVAQHEGSGLVILKLRGGSFSACKGGARKSGALPSGRPGRRLWGSGKGKFRTEGNYGSATVRGTVWLTEDRCDGTFFKVKKGVVAVRDFVAGTNLSLGPGKSYFAKKSGWRPG